MSFNLPDNISMAQCRLAKEYPVRELGSLDHERCVVLHNLIVERGWTQRGFELHQLDKRTAGVLWRRCSSCKHFGSS
jgi:hypothetical protein